MAKSLEQNTTVPAYSFRIFKYTAVLGRWIRICQVLFARAYARGHTSLVIVLGSAQNTAKVSIVTFCYENICTKMLVYYIVHWRKFYVFHLQGA